MEKDQIDWGKLGFFIFALLCAICAFIWGKQLIHRNNEAISVIVTIFSVFAGFIIGIMSLTTDTSYVAKHGKWRFTQLYKTIVVNRIVRQRWLFELYLFTLALIFISTLVKNKFVWSHWIERSWFAFAVFAFILSFRLPWSISKIQMEKYDEVLEEQRSEVNIPTRN